MLWENLFIFIFIFDSRLIFVTEAWRIRRARIGKPLSLLYLPRLVFGDGEHRSLPFRTDRHCRKQPFVARALHRLHPVPIPLIMLRVRQYRQRRYNEFSVNRRRRSVGHPDRNCCWAGRGKDQLSTLMPKNKSFHTFRKCILFDSVFLVWRWELQFLRGFLWGWNRN